MKADKRTTAKKVAVAERQTILICGKETVLKSTGGRKRRKHPMETLVILAYKARLALECKANDMVAALEIYDEMREKGIKRDLSVSFFSDFLVAGMPLRVLAGFVRWGGLLSLSFVVALIFPLKPRSDSNSWLYARVRPAHMRS